MRRRVKGYAALLAPLIGIALFVIVTLAVPSSQAAVRAYYVPTDWTALNDTYVAENDPNRARGDGPDLWVNSSDGNRALILLSFNLTTLPRNATVLGTGLHLFPLQNPTFGATLQLSEIRGLWNATNITWATQPPMANESNATGFVGGINVGGGGGGGPGGYMFCQGIVANRQNPQFISSCPTGTWISSVQRAYERDPNHYGWAISALQGNSGSVAIRVHSSNTSNINTLPNLSVMLEVYDPRVVSMRFDLSLIHI